VTADVSGAQRVVLDRAATAASTRSAPIVEAHSPAHVPAWIHDSGASNPIVTHDDILNDVPVDGYVPPLPDQNEEDNNDDIDSSPGPHAHVDARFCRNGRSSRRNVQTAWAADYFD
jgi:hypothetical protein